MELDRGTIRVYLAELGEELASSGVRGDMFVVGGAAMALAYETRRATRDIDAVFEPKIVVYEAAARVERDTDDIATLYRLSGFTGVEDALAHVEHVYPHLTLLPRVGYLLEELEASGQLE